MDDKIAAIDSSWVKNPSIDAIIARVASLIDQFEARKGRFALGLLVAFSSFALSLLLAFPLQIIFALGGHYKLDALGHLNSLGDDSVNYRYVLTYLPEVADPWRATVPPDYVQVRQRILAPVLAHYLGLRGNWSVLVPVAANVPLLLICFLSMRRRAGAPFSALLTVSISLTLVTVTSQCWAGYQDSLANLCLLAALYISLPIPSALMILLGMFADERIIAAAPLLLLWHATDPQKKHTARNSFIRFIPLVAAFSLWLTFYLLFIRHQHINTHEVAAEAYGSPLKYLRQILPGIYFALRADWIFPFMGLILCCLGRQWGRAAALLGGILLVIATSIPVLDISRISAVAFPAVLIGADWINRHLRPHAVIIALVILLGNIASPILSITGAQTQYFYPAPVILFHWARK